MKKRRKLVIRGLHQLSSLVVAAAQEHVRIEPRVTPDRFGRDHWSTFAYVETVATDNQPIDKRRMRTDRDRHPLLVGTGTPDFGQRYPSRLANGETVDDHDDWDCLDDLEAAGLIVIISLVNGLIAMTPRGQQVAAALRAHKQAGGQFAVYTMPEVTT